ncbi:BN159_2729 family protein [Streptomyces griseoluteus]|uniref:BN159_2729 family protein n=1 Tax=Streptomyces griseoluteus TaxID=29306 RepID=UPI0033CC7A3A
MNSNLPRATQLVREAISAPSSDTAAAVVQALNAAGLLADPERSYGMLLRRTPSGWTPSDQPLTELEEQALAWDASCQHARQVATTVEALLKGSPEFLRVQVDGDRLIVSLHITDQAQWAGWRQYFAVQHEPNRKLPHVQAGEGYRDGVRVTLLGYDMPQAQADAAARAKQPYEFDGIVYDLARPLRDANGGIWHHQGEREDGMPLLSLAGRMERCSLANTVWQAGPLTPVSDTPSTQVNPVIEQGVGGEAA